MNSDRDDYMHRQEMDHDLLRQRDPTYAQRYGRATRPLPSQPPEVLEIGVAETIAPTADAYMRACRALHWRTAQLKAHGIEPLQLHENTPQYPPDNVQWKARHPLHAPCGHSEPEGAYRDPDTGAHRTARCEGAHGLVVRGNGLDSTTDGTMWMGSRPCPNGNKP